MGKKNIKLIVEDISFPIDEGVKKFSFQLAKYFVYINEKNKVFSSSTNWEIPSIESLPKNKLLFSFPFYRNIRKYNPSSIIYVPASSSTLMSFVRLKLLSLFSNVEKTIMISVQERKHNGFSKFLLKFLKPDQIIVLSKKEAAYYSRFGIKSVVSSIGVNTVKFSAIGTEAKNILKKQLGLPSEGKIILHVGHINKGRNIDMLKVLLSKGYHIVVIGSTCFKSDEVYKRELEKEGLIFINHYIDKIEEYYQASDIYAFPVKETMSAMEFPLSVLEAMACNLPILSTKFGGLIDSFSESNYFKYFDTEEELLEKVSQLTKLEFCNNRNIIEAGFTWNKIFENLIT